MNSSISHKGEASDQKLDKAQVIRAVLLAIADFESFFQVKGTSTRYYDGFGLGLAICEQLVQLMGGEVSVHNTPEQGSVFRFTIPEQTASAPKSIAPDTDPRLPKASKPVLEGQSILVVEDDQGQQEVISQVLLRAGAEVRVAQDEEEIIKLLQGQRIDLILLDIQMPYLDGYALIEKIRNILGLSLPIMAMTSHLQPSDQGRYLAKGMDDCMVKPVDSKILLLKVGQLLGLNKIFSDLEEVEAKPLCLDRAGALARLTQDCQTYDMLLHLFVQRHADVGPIFEALDRNNTDQAIKLLHSMRGATMTIGALALNQAILGLEDALRRRVPSDMLFQARQAFALAHRELLSEITLSSFAENVRSEQTALGSSLKLLDLLDDFLQQRNLKADKIASDLLTMLQGSVLHEQAKELRDTIIFLDYDRAADMVRGLRQDLIRSDCHGLFGESANHSHR